MAYAFFRIGDLLETRLELIEAVMVRQLLDEMCDLLSSDDDVDPDDVDPLARQLGLEDMTDLSAAAIFAPEDPVLNRLLPDGYRDDPMAASEFRRYTDGGLRAAKIADAEVVRAGLDRADDDDDGVVRVAQDAAPSWLRSINDLRLALGVRLNITAETAADFDPDELDDSDPRAAQAAIYDFLTWWQDSLVRALMGEDAWD